jgi:hypothetical protein
MHQLSLPSRVRIIQVARGTEHMQANNVIYAEPCMHQPTPKNSLYSVGKLAHLFHGHAIRCVASCRNYQVSLRLFATKASSASPVVGILRGVVSLERARAPIFAAYSKPGATFM